MANMTYVDTYLANSNNERRSNYVTVGAVRSEIPSTGTAGYQYKATFMNHVSQWSAGYITGSWSPDNK